MGDTSINLDKKISALKNNYLKRGQYFDHRGYPVVAMGKKSAPNVINIT